LQWLLPTAAMPEHTGALWALRSWALMCPHA